MGLSHMGSSIEWVIFAIVIFRAVQQLGERRRKLSSLWVFPVLVLYLAFNMITRFQPHVTAVSLALLGGGFIVGALIGLLRAATTQVRATETPGEVIVQGSWLTLAVWLVLFALRFAADTVWGIGRGATTANFVMVSLLAGTGIARNAALYYKARQASAV